jgi:hypothetical protein
MGMRLDELANSSLHRKGNLEEGLRRGESRREQIEFQDSFKWWKKFGDPKGREAPLFWVCQTVAFRIFLFHQVENQKNPP